MLFSLVKVLHARCKNLNKYEEKTSFPEFHYEQLGAIHSTIQAGFLFLLEHSMDFPSLKRLHLQFPLIGILFLSYLSSFISTPHFLQFSSDFKEACYNHSYSNTSSHPWLPILLTPMNFLHSTIFHRERIYNVPKFIQPEVAASGFTQVIWLQGRCL